MQENMTPPTYKHESLEALGQFETTDIRSAIETLAADYGSYSDALSKAEVREYQAEAKRDSVAAMIATQARQDAIVRGIKVTDKSIAAYVEQAQPWVAAQDEYSNITAETAWLKKALKTIDKKERALELLARYEVKELGIISRTQ